MIQLNLPAAPLEFRNEAGKLYVFDPIRKRHLVLTPEEWVRQHLIYFLYEHKKFPKSLFRVERGLKYNTLSKRTDIVIFDRDGNPFLLVECKSPQAGINEAVFRQAAAYNNTLKAPYYMLSNGLKHYCCRVDHASGESAMIPELPDFPE